MDNRKGNLSSSNAGDRRKSYANKRKSTKGYYYLAFTEPFERLTDRDIELRRDYAKDAVARYYGISKDLINLRKKSRESEGVSLDEIYYVNVGKEPVGKISLRISRFSGDNNHMILIYQNKRATPKRKVQKKFRPIETDKEKRRRKKKQKRTSRKGKNKKRR